MRKITGEQPPVSADTALREWLSRLALQINSAFDSVNDFEDNKRLPDNVFPGMLRFFAAPILPDITTAGLYFYLDDKWNRIDFAAAVMALAPANQYSVGINGGWADITSIAGFPSYVYEGDLVSPPPGHVTLNNTDLTLVTEIQISAVNNNGVVSDFIVEKIRPGNTVSVTEFLDNTNFAGFDVTGPAIDQGAYFSIPVNHRVSNGSFTDEELLQVQVKSFSKPRVLNIVASGKRPNSGKALGFGADIKGNTVTYCIPFTGKFSAITISRTDDDDSTIEIIINGTVVQELFTTEFNTVYEPLYIGVTQGEALEVKVKSGARRINNAIVSIVLEEL